MIESNFFLEVENPNRNLQIQTEVRALQAGESRAYARADFRASCDEQDRVIYMSVARVLADRFGCDLDVLEDDLVFRKR